MAEWSPAQLDLLEDALEDIEHEGALERWLEDEPDPVLRERLEDYRMLLQASRDAMPMEDVPDGLLDDVFAEAQRAAATPPLTERSSTSWWTRLRRSFLVPAVALAGTAMLVLWIGKPEDQAERLEQPAAPAPAEAELEADEELPAASEPSDDPAPPPEAIQAAPSVPRAGLADEKTAAIAEPEPEPELAEDADDESAEGSLSTFGEAPNEAQKQAGAGGGAPAGPANGRWDLISLGDRARQAGDCVAARDEYALALEDDDPRVRARAFAGIGLCDAQAGDQPSADANFERGRELDASIDTFIQSQSERRSSTKKPKRRTKSKKSSSKLDPMAADPFN